MRFGWVGFHMEGRLALEAMVSGGVRLEALITLKPEAAAKRSGNIDCRALGERHGIAVYEIQNINDADAVALLRSLELDVVFVIGWSQIVRPEALGTARIGMIGAHASMLPHNRGSAPVNWAIIRGERETGNTLFWLADDVDGGDIIDQRKITITPYDTCRSIYDAVAAANRDMILDLIPRLQANQRPSRRQPATDEPILPRRRPQDGLIDWGRTSQRVYDFIRALTKPYPGAFSFLDDRRWTIWDAAVLPAEAALISEPARVVGPLISPLEGSCGQLVSCGEGGVILLEIEDENGTVLSGQQLSEQRWEGKVWQRET